MKTAMITMEGVGTFTLQSRSELRTPVWQGTLARARAESRQLWCVGHTPAARLFPVTTPSGSLSLRRQALLHTPHCSVCAGLPHISDDSGVVYAASVILTPRVPAGASPAVCTAQVDGATHGTLSHLLQKCSVDGWKTAFLATNSGRRNAGLELMNPGFPEVLLQTLASLRATPVGDSSNAFACARAHGRRAYFGWTDVDLAALARDMITGSAIAWDVAEAWDDQGGPAPQHFIMSHGCPIAGKFLAFGNVISAPFFFFLSADPEGRIGRLWLGPVAGLPHTAVIVESEPERCFADLCAANGIAMQKPVQTGDEVIALGKEFFSADGCNRVVQDMQSRPDFVIWRSSRVAIVQVVGSTKPAYQAELTRTRKNITTALRGSGVTYHEVDCKRSSIEDFIRLQKYAQPRERVGHEQLPQSESPTQFMSNRHI